ncbi:MAG: AAA family ATPase [Planctomycetes bacterium]|nr:AAA family ATPase [Planctomycetota bacterium]
MAQLRSITLRNFKGIGEHAVKVPMRPITLLFGPNSAGKSTVLQAMQYAREILKRNNVNPDRTMAGGDAIDLGGFEGLVHRHDLTRTVEMTFEIAISGDGLSSTMASAARSEIERAIDELTRGTTEQRYSSTDDLRQLKRDERAELASLQGQLDALSWQDVGSHVSTASVELRVGWDRERVCAFVQRLCIGLNGEPFGEVIAEGAGHSPFIALQHDHSLIRTIDSGRTKVDLAETGSEIEGGELRRAWLEWTEPGLPIYMMETDGLRFDQNLAINFGEAERADIGVVWLRILDQALLGPVRLLTEAMDSMRYLGPVREVPRRGFQPHRHPSEHRWASGLGAWDALHRHLDSSTGSGDEVFNSVRRWLTETDCLDLGVGIEIFDVREVPENHPLMDALLKAALEQDDLEQGFVRREILAPMQALPMRRKLRLIDAATDTEIDAHDLGVGVSQVIPVVVGAIEPGFSVFSVEQPELHIHPKVQVALADLFVEQIKRLPGQFLLETHSEHLLLRLLRRVRETAEGKEASPARGLKPGDLSVVVVQAVPTDDGPDRVVFFPIPVTEDGDFNVVWPDGFFPERGEELF